MKANNTDAFAPCEGCGLSARQMFYDMMEDDNITSHKCEPKKRITIGDILLIIFFIGISLMLVVSFILLGAYLRTVF